MIAKEVFAQVRRIEIRTRRLVNEVFGGKYLSVFKGRGMEFAEVREYVPGDDVRTIDWNVTARMRRPYVRRYQDERELTVAIACDLSASQTFGTGLKLKKEIAAELSALLAFSALRNQDKVGLFLFTDRTELYIPPRKGPSHILTLIRDLLAFDPEGHKTAIAAGLDTLNRLFKRRSILFLISDFLDRDFDKAIRRTAIKHDLIPVVIEDRSENELPDIPAWLELQDPETGDRAVVHARSAGVRERLKRQRQAWRQKLERLFQSAGVEAVSIRTDRPAVDPLVRFFKARAKRFGR